ncbi:unnamed protein product [Protopolystoma xenopodis]|uniref:mRNA m(6)A methyltransferase n=1 Tax=Protopolystoma xenopodis TaxID=117903 RepID=A0A3S5AHT2_9PLAT|nr:unnamed protein product [Protopolystoma xenopodis]
MLLSFFLKWINCDIRLLDMSILGKFAVIMADPPWDIHMELPYGTMSDEEMRRLDIPCLQDDGYIFLWVTGRRVLAQLMFHSVDYIMPLHSGQI